MSLPMSSPTKHPKTGTYRVRLAIPKHLRETTERLYGKRAELIANLATRDAKEARRLAPAATGQLRAMLEEAERAVSGAASQRVTAHQIDALAGVFYRRQVAQFGDDPGDEAGWEAELDRLSDQIEPDSSKPATVTLTKHELEPARELLTEHSLPADPATAERLGEAIFRARGEVAQLMLRRTEGDWRPDTAASRFPALPVPEPTAASVVPFASLLEGLGADSGWGRLDALPISRALYDRKRTLARLQAFLGHNDAAKVGKADAVRWKVSMLTRGLHASTVRNDLSECSAIWAWGIRNGKLPENASNPFAGILPPKAAKRATTRRAFTDAEAAAILQQARKSRGVLRWLPWVCCLTGARISEIVQSVREDMADVNGVTVLRIHDEGEGRSLKNTDSRRIVPLHPALIQEGFADYVRSLPAGSPLFPDVRPDKLFNRHATEAGRKVGRWLRGPVGIIDPQVAPNHSWRHYFIDACRRVSMPLEVRSALTGHSARLDESAGYGGGVQTMVQLMADAISQVQLPPGVEFADAEVR